MADTSRNCDLSDIIVSSQKNAGETAPTTSPYFMGSSEVANFTEVVSVNGWGPPYVCTSATVPTAGQIVCGYFSCG